MIAEPTAILNRTFGFQLVNGSVHIGSVLGFFGLVDGANPRYLGPEIARGIPCLRWQTCHVLDNNSYTLDYLFSAEDWMDAYSDGPVPVQIRLLGSRLDGNGQVLRINHTYNFVAFNSGPDSVPDEVFVVPNGLACRGRIPGIPLPVLPPYFSMYLENVRAETKESQIIRVSGKLIVVPPLRYILLLLLQAHVECVLSHACVITCRVCVITCRVYDIHVEVVCYHTWRVCDFKDLLSVVSGLCRIFTTLSLLTAH